MSKISVTTIAGLTSGGDANKVKIESGDTLEVVSNATVGGTLGVTGATTLSGAFTSQGIDDNANNTAIAIDTNEDFTITKQGTNTTDIRLANSSNSFGGNIKYDHNVGNMIFHVHNGERIRFRSDGGICFNGDTAAANALDDYEEGTFTATLVATGSTFQYTYRTGSYTKIGNSVHFNLYIQLDGGGNSFVGNAVTISGLPFTADSAARNNFRYYVHGRYLNVDGANYYYVTANLANGSAGFSLNMAGDNVPNSALPATYLSSSSGQLFINGHYIIN